MVSSNFERTTMQEIEEKTVLCVDVSNEATGSLDLFEDGGHCTWGLCRQFDFLPRNCESCNKMFCRHHCGEAEHECTAFKPSEKIPVCPTCDQALRRPKGMPFFEFLKMHQDSGCKKFLRTRKQRCKAKKCRALPKFSCSGCNKNFCGPHRWDDMHKCSHEFLGNNCRAECTIIPPSAALNVDNQVMVTRAC